MKTQNLVLIFLASIILFMPIVLAEEESFDFTSEYALSQLDSFSEMRYYADKASSFTIAGEERQCSRTADVTQYFSSIPKTVTCNGRDGLINFYAITSEGGWKYLFERECPSTFNPASSLSPTGKWAYEIYYCNPLTPTCSSGDRRCVSESVYEYCSNNAWVRKTCSSGTVCSKGSCVDNTNAQCISSTRKTGQDGANGYTTCTNGQIVWHACQAGTLFDTRAEDCISTQDTPVDGVDTDNEQDIIDNSDCTGWELLTGTCNNGGGDLPVDPDTNEVTASGALIVIDTVGYPLSAKPAEVIDVNVHFVNPADAPITFFAESAIYREDYVESQGLMSVVEAKVVRACGGVVIPESFVQAQQITLDAHSDAVVTFKPRVPTSLSLFGSDAPSWRLKANWLGEGAKYKLVVGTYEKCASGYWKYQVKDFAISDAGTGIIPDDDGTHSGTQCAWYEVKKTHTSLTTSSVFSFLNPLAGIFNLLQGDLPYTTVETCEFNYSLLIILGLFVLGFFYIVFRFGRR